MRLKTKTLLDLDAAGEIEISNYTFLENGDIVVEVSEKKVIQLLNALVSGLLSFSYRALVVKLKIVHEITIKR